MRVCVSSVINLFRKRFSQHKMHEHIPIHTNATHNGPHIGTINCRWNINLLHKRCVYTRGAHLTQKGLDITFTYSNVAVYVSLFAALAFSPKHLKKHNCTHLHRGVIYMLWLFGLAIWFDFCFNIQWGVDLERERSCVCIHTYCLYLFKYVVCAEWRVVFATGVCVCGVVLMLAFPFPCCTRYFRVVGREVSVCAWHKQKYRKMNIEVRDLCGKAARLRAALCLKVIAESIRKSSAWDYISTRCHLESRVHSVE